jgi:hypothetical protein
LDWIKRHGGNNAGDKVRIICESTIKKMKTDTLSYMFEGIFFFYSITMLLILPAFFKERVLIISTLIDFLIKILIVFSLCQSFHFLTHFEQSITRFYYGAAPFRISGLRKGMKSCLVIFSLLSGISTYLIMEFLLSRFLPTLLHYTKYFAFIFALFISIPLLLKMKTREKTNRL